MYRILVIDDERNVLTALRRCLSGIDVSGLAGEALTIETFSSPEAAIERCEEQDFDLVISDYRMPTMNGVQVLSRLMETQPFAPRVIISAFADRDVIIAAINEAHLTQFVEKPWNDEELRTLIAAILLSTQRGVGNTVTSLTASIAHTRRRKRLEQASPGITEIDRDVDGGIVIAPEDWDD